MIKITDLMPEEIAEALAIKRFQGSQIFKWVHAKRVFNFESMTDLSKTLRERLENEAALPQIHPVGERKSTEPGGTRKTLYALSDGEAVEAVLIPDGERVTICVSSQVGCAMGCSFCATGQSGFVRNLSCGEIVEQALYFLREENIVERTPNIVYMGMGEPLLNYDEVRKSIKMLMRKNGVNIGARKITVSTYGDVPGIERFAEEKWQVRLSISLHAANDALRTKLVPASKKYPLKVLMQAVRNYCLDTDRQVTFEWTLMKDVNDSVRDAQEFIKLMSGLRSKVFINLIPYNQVEGLDYEPASLDACRHFQNTLNAEGLKATLRRERGGDIDAACGQLRARSK